MTLEEIHALKGTVTIDKDAYLLAADILETSDVWTQGDYAKNEADESASFDSPTACRWCAFGLIGLLLDKNPLGIGDGSEIGFNDDQAETAKDVADYLRGLAEALP